MTDPERLGGAPVVLDCVHSVRIRDRDDVRVRQGGALAGRAQADAPGRAGSQGHEPAAGESLQIDYQVEPALAQVAGEGERRPRGPLPAAVQGPAVEGDRLVETRVAVEERLVGAVDDPGDVGVGKLVPQRPEDGEGVDDVAEGAGLDEGDALHSDFVERRSATFEHPAAPSAHCTLTDHPIRGNSGFTLPSTSAAVTRKSSCWARSSAASAYFTSAQGLGKLKLV